jgi:hypothetical protein
MSIRTIKKLWEKRTRANGVTLKSQKQLFESKSENGQIINQLRNQPKNGD